jgi:hypothetical protein
MKHIAWILTGWLIIGSCRNRPDTKNLREAMQTYDRLILKTDADSIALSYTVDGELGEMALGRDSIRRFLYKFKDFKVLHQVSLIDTINIHQDTGYLAGSYQQRVIVPHQLSGDTVSVKGNFQSTWIWTPGNGWLIKKMQTQPLK